MRCVLQRRRLRLANVDPDRNRRPSPVLAQLVQSFRDHVRAIVVESETIDQRLLLGKTENARLRVSRLPFRGHRAEFDETKTESRPRRQGHAVLVQSGRKSDRIWKVKAEERFRFRWRLKESERAQRKIKLRSAAKQFDGKTMSGLGIQRKEQRPNQPLVRSAAAVHLLTPGFSRVPAEAEGESRLNGFHSRDPVITGLNSGVNETSRRWRCPLICRCKTG